MEKYALMGYEVYLLKMRRGWNLYLWDGELIEAWYQDEKPGEDDIRYAIGNWEVQNGLHD